MSINSTPLRERARIAMISIHGYVAAQPPLGAADTGGQVVYVLELSRRLAALGYDVDIWTRRFHNQEEIESVEPHVRIIRISCGGGAFIPKEYLFRSIQEWIRGAMTFIGVHDLTYQFINSHYWDAGLAGDYLATALEIPHLHTPHSLGWWKLRQMEQDYPESRGTFEQQYNFSERIESETRILGRATQVIATTPMQIDLLTGEYGVAPDSVRMIPPGYDDSRFFPVGEPSRMAIRERLGFQGRIILALGRLARNKGYDLLIRAFAVVASRLPDATLYLAVGGASLSQDEVAKLVELQELIESLGLVDRVRVAGFIDDDELADYYRAADLFVLSSRYEPFGMTAVEAMACGTPTVVTTHGGLWQALTFGRHVLFADPFDAEDLGITMLKPLQYPRLHARLSRMGASRARELFTWTGIAHQLIAAVESGASQPTESEEDEWAEPWTGGE